MPQIFKHYAAYQGPWPWRDFRPQEFACRHCGELAVHAPSLNALQRLREAWGKPVIVTSGHRCAAHNAAVGGKDESAHLRLAFDCLCPAPEQDYFVTLARRAGFTGIGRYPKQGFVHLDLGKPRNW